MLGLENKYVHKYVFKSGSYRNDEYTMSGLHQHFSNPIHKYANLKTCAHKSVNFILIAHKD